MSNQPSGFPADSSIRLAVLLRIPLGLPVFESFAPVFKLANCAGDMPTRLAASVGPPNSASKRRMLSRLISSMSFMPKLHSKTQKSYMRVTLKSLLVISRFAIFIS